VALIRLTGRHAIGAHTHAIVDDDMVDFLLQWRWKAKPNAGGNNVYAVRNAMRDGKHVTLRMHRIVAGLSHDDPHDVDHDNHNSLDNRRMNLLRATRSENTSNARQLMQSKACQHCGGLVVRQVSALAASKPLTCDQCKLAQRAAQRRRRRARELSRRTDAATRGAAPGAPGAPGRGIGHVNGSLPALPTHGGTARARSSRSCE